MKLRNKLLEIRLERGFKFQNEFADFLGVDRSLLNRWELQKRQPERDNIWKIIKKLEIDMRDLFEEQE